MKLQVISPRRVTGGPEAVHQLVDAARTLGVDARVVYAPIDSAHRDVTPAYAHYSVAIDTAISDDADTVVIAPETLTRHLSGLRRARRAIWWLSVDNYLVDRRRQVALWAERLKLRRPRFDLASPIPDVRHLAQSEYARRFLVNHGIHQIAMLTDYLREDFTSAPENSTNRPATVTFNPLKGFETTRRLMAAAPHGIHFVPLQNMTPREVRATLEHSAVYMDFGHHPGRDRLPREAALCGCAIVTGTRGAAGNDVDIPIPARFKVDESATDFVERALHTIAEACRDYRRIQPEFDAYRRAILDQKHWFFKEVKQFVDTLV
jgi:hypothetical protein